MVSRHTPDLTGGTPRKFTPEGGTYAVPSNEGEGGVDKDLTGKVVTVESTHPDYLSEGTTSSLPYTIGAEGEGVGEKYSSF